MLYKLDPSATTEMSSTGAAYYFRRIMVADLPVDLVFVFVIELSF